jgi:hypothetical protein
MASEEVILKIGGNDPEPPRHVFYPEIISVMAISRFAKMPLAVAATSK